MNDDVLFLGANVLVYRFDEDEPRKQENSLKMTRVRDDQPKSNQALMAKVIDKLGDR